MRSQIQVPPGAFCAGKLLLGVHPVIRQGALSNDRANPMYYVYLLLLINKKIYTGSANDLKTRIKEHNLGKVKSTKNFRPIRLILYEAYILKSDAQRRERFLKTTEGKRLLRMQIRDYLVKIQGPLV